MIPMPDLAVRAAVSERMDAPDCSEEKLLRTVRQFASINRLVSRYRGILRRWVLRDMLRDPSRIHHLVDMGAGGCDIDVWLLAACRRRGLRLRITACDADPRVVAYARSAHGSVEGLAIRRMDVVSEAFAEKVDYIFANHFLHHLTNAQMTALLRQWAPLVRRFLLFSDLYRGAAPYAGFSLLSLFYTNSFAREDGLLSIRRGFTPQELSALAESAGVGARSSVHRFLPGRLLLRIQGTDPAQ
jgi:SAM-dependent methyltransferase